MKIITKEWFVAAEDDLIAAKNLINEERLTNIVAFHCQQCIEKCLKALIEEQMGMSVKSHDLLRLKDIANLVLSDEDIFLLSIINEVYTDTRYPGNMGLMPQGKPSVNEVKNFVVFCDAFFNKLKDIIQ